MKFKRKPGKSRLKTLYISPINNKEFTVLVSPLIKKPIQIGEYLITDKSGYMVRSVTRKYALFRATSNQIGNRVRIREVIGPGREQKKRKKREKRVKLKDEIVNETVTETVNGTLLTKTCNKGFEDKRLTSEDILKDIHEMVRKAKEYESKKLKQLSYDKEKG